MAVFSHPCQEWPATLTDILFCLVVNEFSHLCLSVCGKDDLVVAVAAVTEASFCLLFCVLSCV